MTIKILRIDASARTEGSVSRELNDNIIARLGETRDIIVESRDLAATSLPFINEEWIGANFTAADARSTAQKETLSFSDKLVSEVKAADILLIGLPIYNFGVPAALKAWIDLVARVGLTFSYTEAGPKGLLSGKRAIVAVASGGTQAGSEIDFATTHMRQVLSFVGIDDVTFVTADGLAVDPEGTLQVARNQIAELSLAA